jgi:hypothetical protein
LSIKSEVTNLIGGLRRYDPRVHQALELLAGRLTDIDEELHPRTSPGSVSTGIVLTDLISPPDNFVITSTGSTTRLSWDAAVGAFQYEIRKGTTWASASFVTRTSGLRADVDPLIYGFHTYLIKSLTIGSAYSTGTNTGVFTVSQIDPPTVSTKVIDNNVLLYWTAPTSTYTIDQYEVKRNGVSLGFIRGTFTSFFEQVGGTYSYSVTAIDVAGNEGDEAVVSIVVNQPPDYAIQDTFVSDLGGVRVNVLVRN